MSSASRHHVAMAKRSSKRARTAGHAEDDAGSGPDHVNEEGAFAFATCPVCAWRGPARRSRARARKDLEHHLAADAAHREVAEEPTG
jgi:hypothetical protein